MAAYNVTTDENGDLHLFAKTAFRVLSSASIPAHDLYKLKELIQRKQSKSLIEVDGGVDLTNANQLFETGANILVAGNSIFSSADPKKTISKLKKS